MLGLNRGYEESWPPVRGDFTVVDPKKGVAVVTLASQIMVNGAAIYGPCKTENLGIEKIVANTISNSNIRFLLICGAESKGHLPGDSILALHRNGIDEKGRIIGAKGAIPFIQNLNPEAIKRFQRQLELIERIGLEDQDEIERLVALYSKKVVPFSEEPYSVFKKKTRQAVVWAGEGDLQFGAGIVMSTPAWLVRRGEDSVQV